MRAVCMPVIFMSDQYTWLFCNGCLVIKVVDSDTALPVPGFQPISISTMENIIIRLVANFVELVGLQGVEWITASMLKFFVYVFHIYTIRMFQCHQLYLEEKKIPQRFEVDENYWFHSTGYFTTGSSCQINTVVQAVLELLCT